MEFRSKENNYMIKKHNEKASEGGFELGMGGMLKGFGDLIDKLGELAKTGEQMSRTGEIHGAGKEVKGIYGVTVKVGLGDDRPTVEPFGNIRQDRESGHTVVQEVREPVVDVFEEDDHVLVVAEMPGVGVEDVHITVEDDLLTFSAERGDKKYRKEVLLPASSLEKKIEVACNNGVVEIKCKKCKK
jgi:HSP20 family protein